MREAVTSTTARPKIRSDLNYETTRLAATSEPTKDFTSGTGSSSTGNGKLNEGLSAMLGPDQAVVSHEQSNFMKKKYGPDWVIMLSQRTKSGRRGTRFQAPSIAEEKRKITEAEPVILHGKEQVLNAEQSDELRSIEPGLWKIGQRKKPK